MKKYEDGVYLTRSTFGSKSATRVTIIENGYIVEIDGKRDFPGVFNQSFFFDVNVMVSKVCKEQTK